MKIYICNLISVDGKKLESPKRCFVNFDKCSSFDLTNNKTYIFSYGMNGRNVTELVLESEEELIKCDYIAFNILKKENGSNKQNQIVITDSLIYAYEENNKVVMHCNDSIDSDSSSIVYYPLEDFNFFDGIIRSFIDENTNNQNYFEIDTIQALELMNNRTVVIGATYRVQMQLGTDYLTFVYLKGLRSDLISNFGERWLYAPKKDGYNDGWVDTMMNTWRGIMVTGTTYNKGDVTIWGGRVWKCIAVGGAVGSYIDSKSLSSDFSLINKDEKYYDLLNHSVVVDFNLDKIIEESDNKGNKVNVKNITDYTEDFYTDNCDWNCESNVNINLLCFVNVSFCNRVSGKGFILNNYASSLVNVIVNKRIEYCNNLQIVDSSIKEISNSNNITILNSSDIECLASSYFSIEENCRNIFINKSTLGDGQILKSENIVINGCSGLKKITSCSDCDFSYHSFDTYLGIKNNSMILFSIDLNSISNTLYNISEIQQGSRIIESIILKYDGVSGSLDPTNTFDVSIAGFTTTVSSLDIEDGIFIPVNATTSIVDHLAMSKAKPDNGLLKVKINYL